MLCFNYFLYITLYKVHEIIDLLFYIVVVVNSVADPKDPFNYAGSGSEIFLSDRIRPRIGTFDIKDENRKCLIF